MTDTTAPAMPPITGVTPYLIVDGASDAADLYARAFGAQVINRMPAEDGKRLMHSCLQINGGPLMMSDAFPEYGHPVEAPQGYVLHLQVDDIDTWWSRAVDAGLEVVMPVELQFWGDRYGQLRDRFGVRWSLGCTPAA